MKFVFSSLALCLLFATALSQGPYQLFGGGPPFGPVPFGLGPPGGFGGPSPIYGGGPFAGVSPGGFGGSGGPSGFGGPIASFGPPPFSGPSPFGPSPYGGGGGGGGGGASPSVGGNGISGYSFSGIGSPTETASLGGFALGGRFGGLLQGLGRRR